MKKTGLDLKMNEQIICIGFLFYKNKFEWFDKSLYSFKRFNQAEP